MAGVPPSGLYLKSVWQVEESQATSWHAAAALELTEVLYDFGLFAIHPDYEGDYPKDFRAQAQEVIKPEHQLQLVEVQTRNPIIVIVLIPIGIGAAVKGFALAAGALGVATAAVKLGAGIAKAKVESKISNNNLRTSAVQLETAELERAAERLKLNDAQVAHENLERALKQSGMRMPEEEISDERPAA